MGGSVFVVAGDSREPAGEFPDSVSLLDAIAAEATTACTRSASPAIRRATASSTTT